MKILKILSLIYWIIFVFLIFMAGVVVLSNLNRSYKYRMFSVDSGSMQPAITQGSLILIQKSDTYGEKDIITYRGEGNTKQVVTHRIMRVSEDKDLGKVSFETKGDANEDPDREMVDG